MRGCNREGGGSGGGGGGVGGGGEGPQCRFQWCIRRSDHRSITQKAL